MSIVLDGFGEGPGYDSRLNTLMAKTEERFELERRATKRLIRYLRSRPIAFAQVVILLILCQLESRWIAWRASLARGDELLYWVRRFVAHDLQTHLSLYGFAYGVASKRYRRFEQLIASDYSLFAVSLDFLTSRDLKTICGEHGGWFAAIFQRDERLVEGGLRVHYREAFRRALRFRVAPRL